MWASWVHGSSSSTDIPGRTQLLHGQRASLLGHVELDDLTLRKLAAGNSREEALWCHAERSGQGALLTADQCKTFTWCKRGLRSGKALCRVFKARYPHDRMDLGVMMHAAAHAMFLLLSKDSRPTLLHKCLFHRVTNRGTGSLASRSSHWHKVVENTQPTRSLKCRMPKFSLDSDFVTKQRTEHVVSCTNRLSQVAKLLIRP